jgi:hypothetical protein
MITRRIAAISSVSPTLKYWARRKYFLKSLCIFLLAVRFITINGSAIRIRTMAVTKRVFIAKEGPFCFCFLSFKNPSNDGGSLLNRYA